MLKKHLEESYWLSCYPAQQNFVQAFCTTTEKSHLSETQTSHYMASDILFLSLFEITTAVVVMNPIIHHFIYWLVKAVEGKQ